MCITFQNNTVFVVVTFEEESLKREGINFKI